mmetsp:Transcript_87098/g.173983  ORF Transcript_87098/g.173983 Transcript_87098/m.173983 type:complete len:226 (-) Transcript_87098:646-1323(-)
MQHDAPVLLWDCHRCVLLHAEVALPSEGESAFHYHHVLGSKSLIHIAKSISGPRKGWKEALCFECGLDRIDARLTTEVVFDNDAACRSLCLPPRSSNDCGDRLANVQHSACFFSGANHLFILYGTAMLVGTPQLWQEDLLTRNERRVVEGWHVLCRYEVHHSRHRQRCTRVNRRHERRSGCALHEGRIQRACWLQVIVVDRFATRLLPCLQLRPRITPRVVFWQL